MLSKVVLTRISVPSFVSFQLISSPQLTASMISFTGDRVVFNVSTLLALNGNHVVATQ